MPDALQFLLLTFAGWVNRHQEAEIEYLPVVPHGRSSYRKHPEGVA